MITTYLLEDAIGTKIAIVGGNHIEHNVFSAIHEEYESTHIVLKDPPHLTGEALPDYGETSQFSAWVTQEDGGAKLRTFYLTKLVSYISLYKKNLKPEI